VKQVWPIAGSFRIAHGSVTEIEVVRVTIHEDGFVGHGECRPYARYGENSQSELAQIETAREFIKNSGTQMELASYMPAGAARNAVDCALWDLQAKQSGKPVWELLGTAEPKPRQTAFTLSIDTPTRMAQAARNAAAYPILKLKIDGLRGLKACMAVMKARPDAQLIIDANEALSPKQLIEFRKSLKGYPVLMIEQPVKSDMYDQIENAPDRLPILCADESLHTSADLTKLWQAGYRAVNVKLDKCGGLTEGVKLMREAKEMGFIIMAGCMVGTSLAMAPIMTLESFADVIDLDGPLLLGKDVKNGLRYEGAIIYPPTTKLWG
jgi:L-alanine-DL-glutamate epimerase-like enolase superfamily enzyme